MTVLNQWGEEVIPALNYLQKKKWGSYMVLEQEHDFVIKLLLIDPGAKLSLQRHMCRNEHWMVVRGKIVATRATSDFKTRLTKPMGVGGCITIPKEHWHSAENNGKENAVVVEVWYGECLSEDDIERKTQSQSGGKS